MIKLSVTNSRWHGYCMIKITCAEQGYMPQDLNRFGEKESAVIFLIRNGRGPGRIGSQPVVLCRNMQSGNGPTNHNLLFLKWRRIRLSAWRPVRDH